MENLFFHSLGVTFEVQIRKSAKNSSLLGVPNKIQDGPQCEDFAICLVSMFNWVTFLFSKLDSPVAK